MNCHLTEESEGQSLITYLWKQLSKQLLPLIIPLFEGLTSLNRLLIQNSTVQMTPPLNAHNCERNCLHPVNTEIWFKALSSSLGTLCQHHSWAGNLWRRVLQQWPIFLESHSAECMCDEETPYHDLEGGFTQAMSVQRPKRLCWVWPLGDYCL